ncbi:MAG: hypothetical protein OXI67_07310 [Candidatus Poribacteria bacterium]|nr:hypothetical protein [Candidatus Poribacteria bacterium]
MPFGIPRMVFVQINAKYAFGICPNQRQMRVWHLAGTICFRSALAVDMSFLPNQEINGMNTFLVFTGYECHLGIPRNSRGGG